MKYQSTENNALDFSNQSLTTVPKSILKNPYLRILNLKNNQLTELPSFITELKYLEVLELRNNNFKTVPNELLQLKNLKTLSLSENHLSHIPEKLKLLSNLTDLDIGSNPIDQFPDWLDQFSMLKDLGIYDLGLADLPDVVTRIRYLEVLSLDGNTLKTLPESIKNLKFLKELWAEDNAFEYLPESFGNLSQLEKINLSLNNLEYLPDSICNLKSLEYLSISENSIKTLPNTVGQLNSLTFLDISYNKINTFPDSFWKLSTRNVEVWFDENPYTEATKRQIKRLFPDVEDSELEFNIASTNEDVALVFESKGLSSNAEYDKPSPNRKNNSTTYFIVSLLAILLIIIFFNTSLTRENPLEKAHNKASKSYNAVLKSYRNNFNKVQKSNPYVFIYTNDTITLKASLEPDIDVYINSYAPNYSNLQSKAEALTQFLNDKSLGYNVIVDNNRVELIQAKIFDSVFSDTLLKKYSLVVDYKMSEKEKALKKKRKLKYSHLFQKDIDTVYNSERIVLTSKELSDGKFSSSLKHVLVPIIDLDNKTYHFYFSSYDNNFTKEEFENAIRDFEALFLESDTNKNSGIIKQLFFDQD